MLERPDGAGWPQCIVFVHASRMPTVCCAVYALNELVQASNKNPEDAKQIAAALLRKVSSTNPVVKWKVRSGYVKCSKSSASASAQSRLLKTENTCYSVPPSAHLCLVSPAY